MSASTRTTIPPPATIRRARRSAAAVIAQYIQDLSVDLPVIAARSEAPGAAALPVQ